MEMKILDWVAVLGALAWLPHLITFLKSFLIKPEVRIIAGKSPEIGFTSFGPIFNIRIALSVKYRDLVISNFQLKVTHESGEEKLFEWQGITQQILNMKTTDGSIPYEKEHSVLAMKLNQRDVEERFIRCNEVAFISGKNILEDKAIEIIAFEQSQTGYDPKVSLKKKECRDLYNYIKQAAGWRAGKYRVSIHMESPESFNLVGNCYEFTLLPIDVEYLEKNKGNIEQSYLNVFIPQDDPDFRVVNWNWRYPKFVVVDE